MRKHVCLLLVLAAAVATPFILPVTEAAWGDPPPAGTDHPADGTLTLNSDGWGTQAGAYNGCSAFFYIPQQSVAHHAVRVDERRYRCYEGPTPWYNATFYTGDAPARFYFKLVPETGDYEWWAVAGGGVTVLDHGYTSAL